MCFSRAQSLGEAPGTIACDAIGRTVPVVKDYPVTMKRHGASISPLSIAVTKYLRQLAHKVKEISILAHGLWRVQGQLAPCVWASGEDGKSQQKHF